MISEKNNNFESTALQSWKLKINFNTFDSFSCLMPRILNNFSSHIWKTISSFSLYYYIIFNLFSVIKKSPLLFAQSRVKSSHSKLFRLKDMKKKLSQITRLFQRLMILIFSSLSLTVSLAFFLSEKKTFLLQH